MIVVQKIIHVEREKEDVRRVQKLVAANLVLIVLKIDAHFLQDLVKKLTVAQENVMRLQEIAALYRTNAKRAKAIVLLIKVV